MPTVPCTLMEDGCYTVFTLIMFRILQVFLQNMRGNTKHLVWTFRFSLIKFLISFMPQKN